MLIPTVPNILDLYKIYITRILRIPPAIEYMIPKTPVKRRPAVRILTQFIIKAYLNPSL